MQKTLLITVDFWPKVGGVADYYFNLCKSLDYKQIAVLTDGSGKIDMRESIDFKIYRRKFLVNWLRPKWLKMFYFIWRIVREEKVERMWVGEILPTGTVVYFLSKIINIPYIVSCHGNDLLQASKVGRKKVMAGKILKQANFVLANSKYTAGLVKSFGVDLRKIKIIYPKIVKNNIDGNNKIDELSEKLIAKYGIQGKQILLSVGRLVERKGFDQVIESLDEVFRVLPNLVYVVVGDGPDKERLQKLSSLYRDKIIFTGVVEDKIKWAWFRLSNVFIMPSRQSKEDVEGFGIVYLEANSFSKPVIAGDNGGASEAVVDGVTGILVDAEDNKKIGEAIIRLYKNKEFAKKLGEQGKARVENEFIWQKDGSSL